MKVEYYDNPIFNVSGISKSHLRFALSWFIEELDRVHVTHYYSDAKHFVLCGSAIEKVTSTFPAPLELNAIIEIVYSWIEWAAVYDSPDNMGDTNCIHGWEVYTEKWGHVDGHWQATCGIRPFRGLVGK